MSTPFDYRKNLAEELRLRQARNPSYSLRSFARDLGVSVTALSDVLSAKRDFSKRNAEKVIAKLGWSPLQSASFLRSLGDSTPAAARDSLILEDDRFRIISDWYYLVILNLAKVPGAKATPSWVRKQTGISLEEAREALDRLQRLGYISNEGGTLVRQVPEVATTTEVPSAAIRKYHRQNFHLAERAQENVPFERRQISSFTVGTDPARLKKAKKMLNEFMDKLAAVLESPEPSEVYTVSTQMFPARLTGEDSE